MSNEKKSRTSWTKEKCLLMAKKFQTRSEFKSKAPCAYRKSCLNGWIDEICVHMNQLIQPKGYWTKEKCHELALNYNSITVFRKNNPYIYEKAYKMGWLVDVASHMKTTKAPYGYWNSREHCIEEARKYKTRSSFARNAPTAYGNCIKNGWNEAFEKMEQLLDYSITDEECAIIALKCKSQAQMQREYPKQYSYACRYHILQKIFKHLPKLEQVTKEQAEEAASNCKLRQEFRLRFPREYRFAVNHHILNEVCKDMPVMHDMSKRCVYAYEFPDLHVYVGLTCDVERRKREHRQDGNSAVYLHVQESGLEPSFLIKRDFVDYVQAKELEGIVLREYTDKGWISLNRTGTGGIGCSGSVYSQIKICTASIKFCEDFNQFKERFPSAYKICLERDWFELLEEYLGEKKGDYFLPKRGFEKKKRKVVLSADFVKRMEGSFVPFRYTDEELLEEAKKYRTKTEFAHKNCSAYRQAKDRGIIENLFPQNANLVSNEDLANEASQYRSRVDFKKGSNAHYQLAMKRGILDEICKQMPFHGFRNARIMEAKENKNSNEMGKYWNKERIIATAKEFDSISDFIENESGAYNAARNMGILDEIRSLLTPRQTTWTYEMLVKEAKKYSFKRDFQKGSPNAYTAAHRRGVLDEICSHMVVLRTNWTYGMLAAEAKKYDNVGAFYKCSHKAYDVASKHGILDEICSHMKHK